MTANATIHQWLRSEDFLDLLRQTLHRGDLDHLHDLWIFLQERLANDLHFHHLVATQNIDAIRAKIRYLQKKFFQEQKRDLLYQRVRQSLKQFPETGYHLRGDYAAYGDPQGQPLPAYKELRERNFQPQLLPNKDIRNSKDILEVALHFFHQAKAFLGYAPSIHLREFCAFLRQHYDTSIYDRDEISLEEGSDAEEDSPSILQRLGEATDYEAAITRGRLEAIVLAAAQSLEPKAALVLCYLEHCGWRMEDAARALGYAAACGISAIKKRAYLTLRQVLEPHAGLGEADLDPSLFEAFRERLWDVLCQQVDCRQP
ncbi:hypothetical protein TDMWS_05090 [Thermodesulfomicrobium sp. WS]|uniref:hypothetical protein n=1 Tax=Thermodesulfomicrobium sp. WS TaxID=3004129 RepID=UPI00249374A2|nr:hypothetical protein [Thermodesulfomicrobium sp. WS]BDV00424.1 hypothetical protein TDMWS_05090 [Thermodesulfomicrobium sp. WS]